MIQLDPQLKGLLNSTARITKHLNEIKRLKGETFNLFSILGMESNENATHSAFLGELLNPKGSHLFGTLFLELFIKNINYSGDFDIHSAQLRLEKHIGARNDELKTGGRIDIYLRDGQGNSISIENKIYAIDQYAQIERYVKHNNSKNTVYYLTLNGDEPTAKSSGKLKNGHDYHCISYKSTIIEWLNDCLKETVEQPILRESIRQYIILIKKLTNQLTDSKMEEEIRELISKNYHEAKIIEGNVWKAEMHATQLFLNEVKEKIEDVLKEGWDITVSENLNETWTGIYISHSSWNGINVKLEGDSKVPWSNSIYGIHADKERWDRENLRSHCSNIEILQDDFKESWHWPYYKTVLYLAREENRAKLFDIEKRAHLVEVITNKLITLSKECEIPLSKVKVLEKA